MGPRCSPQGPVELEQAEAVLLREELHPLIV